MPVDEASIFKARMDYHKDLVNRRWQYFATFVVVTGFLLGSSDKLLALKSPLLEVISIGAIMTSCAFIRLIARARLRLSANARKTNELLGYQILDSATEGRSIDGISLWLLVSMVFLTIPWFLVLQTSSVAWALIFATIYLTNLVTLRWRA